MAPLLLLLLLLGRTHDEDDEDEDDFPRGKKEVWEEGDRFL